MTLKYGQGHHTWHDLLDPKQAYIQAKFERPPLNSVRQKESYGQIRKHVGYLP